MGRVAGIDRGSSTFARVHVQPAANVDRSRMLLVLRVDNSSLPAPEPPPEARKRLGKAID